LAAQPADLCRREEELLRLFASGDPMRGAYCSAVFYGLLADLLRTDEKACPRDRAALIAGRLIGFLEDNPTRAVTSEEIESCMRMSYKYLCGVFKRYTGLSIHQYHTRLRINEAARLLRETSLNISEIGYRTGYRDPLYFSHVFKRVKGCSPSEYLKQPF
jgi:AraC family transcriptional regulator of arabinose operon